MPRYIEAGREIIDRQLLFGHLVDHLDSEIFRVTRVAHGTY